MADAVILLTLNKAEAETLFDVLYYGVGGSSKNSRRRHADAVYRALHTAGVEDGPRRDDIDQTQMGVLRFKNSR